MLMYFIENPEKHKTLQSLYEKYLKELREEYITKFYPRGFKDQALFEQTMIDLAQNRARDDYERIQHCCGQIASILIYSSEDEKIHKKIIENRTDFIKWLDSVPKNPDPIKPKMTSTKYSAECVRGSTMERSKYLEHIKKCKWNYIMKTPVVQFIKDLVHWITRGR